MRRGISSYTNADQIYDTCGAPQTVEATTINLRAFPGTFYPIIHKAPSFEWDLEREKALP